MNQKMKHRLMNEAGAGDGGGAGGGAAAPAAAPAPAAAAPSPAPAAPSPAPAAPAPAPASVMSAGAPAQQWAAPDKYLVKNEDGSTNWEATAQKIDGGRSSFEKRFGSGDVRPDDVAGYKIEVPKGAEDILKDWKPAEDQALQAFLKNAHGAGFTQKQVDLVLGEFARVTSDVSKAAQGPSAEQQAETTATALRGLWKDEGQFEQKVGQAFKAANAVGAMAGVPYDEIEAAGLGNNPVFLRLMAALAPELAEDTPVGTQSPQTQGNEGWKAEVAQLRAEKNALPEKDARRNDIQARINTLYEKNTPKERA